MKNSHLGVLAGVLSGLGLLLLDARSLAHEWNADELLSQWLPVSETSADMIIRSSSLISLVAIPTLAVVLGYYVGADLDLATEYGNVLKLVSVGSIAGVIFALALIFSTIPLFFFSFLSFILGILRYVAVGINVGLLIICATFTGATLGSLRTQDSQPQA